MHRGSKQELIKTLFKEQIKRKMLKRYHFLRLEEKKRGLFLLFQKGKIVELFRVVINQFYYCLDPVFSLCFDYLLN